MSEQPPMNDPLDGADGEFERALGQLAPAPAIHSPEKIAYEAGRRAGRQSAIAWRGVSTLLAACLALSVFLEPVQRPHPAGHFAPAPQLVQYQASSANQVAVPQIAPGSYLSIRDRVLIGGVDMLQPAGGSGLRGPTPQVMQVQPYELHLTRLFGGNS